MDGWSLALEWFGHLGLWWAFWEWFLWFLLILFWRRCGSYLAVFLWWGWKWFSYPMTGRAAACRQVCSRSHQLTRCQLAFGILSSAALLGLHKLVYHSSPSFSRWVLQSWKVQNRWPLSESLLPSSDPFRPGCSQVSNPYEQLHTSTDTEWPPPAGTW